MAGEELDRDIGAAKRGTVINRDSLYEITHRRAGNEIEDLYRRLKKRS